MTTDSISNSDGYDEPTNRVTTDEARDRLEETLFSALESCENTLIDAPTSLGKSYTTATTPWREYPEITGSDLVIHVHQTRDARDESVAESNAADGVSWRVFEGREDTCPTAAGKYDDSLTAPHGYSPSEWFEWMCDVRKNGFYSAHRKLEKHCDMPCAETGTCPSLKQWWQTLHDDDGTPTVDVVHTTANFAHVEGLIEDANLVFDERPDYALNLGDSERQQVRDSVSNLLEYRSSGEYAIADLTTANRHDDTEQIQELRGLLNEDVSRDWYFRREETHRLAPEIGMAILNAEEMVENQWADEDVNLSGRRMGQYQGVKVVLNSKGKLRHIQYSPSLSDARCIIGLDAFPSEYRWQLNTVDDLTRENVLPPAVRRRWRQEERGLTVIQVGNSTRSYTSGWDGAGEERAEGLIRALRRRHGDEFRTCITAGSIEDDVRRIMREAGIKSPPPLDGKNVELIMHFGGQNSRNDFEREVVGLLVGCIDPGDKNILDLLALGGRSAWPEMTTTEDGGRTRKTGRSFEGPATDIAREILVSVREANIAQAAGRYARNPDSSDSSALVYVWSDVCPSSLTDEILEVSYHSISDERKTVMQLLQEGYRTRLEIEKASGVDNTRESGVDKSYIHDCLNSFRDEGLVEETKEAEKNGASGWSWVGPECGSDQSDTLVELGS